MSSGRIEKGQWLNSTAYKTKKREQKCRVTPKKVRKADHYESLPIRLSPLPQWQSLCGVEQIAKINDLIHAIVEEAKQKRIGTKSKILGVKKVVQASIQQRVPPPNPPWWQERRRQITAWANPKATQTRAYLDLYFAFQDAFRVASAKFKNKVKAEFPQDSWIPIRYFSPSPA
jgi:hypothetical protein